MSRSGLLIMDLGRLQSVIKLCDILSWRYYCLDTGLLGFELSCFSKGRNSLLRGYLHHYLHFQFAGGGVRLWQRIDPI